MCIIEGSMHSQPNCNVTYPNLHICECCKFPLDTLHSAGTLSDGKCHLLLLFLINEDTEDLMVYFSLVFCGTVFKMGVS